MSLLIKKRYYTESNKLAKLKNAKISFIFNRKLVFSNICNKCGSNGEKVSKEESTEVLKIIGLINGNESYFCTILILYSTEKDCNIIIIYTHLINMVEENVSLNFRLRKIEETINYFLEEIKQRNLMNKTHKKWP